jgi:hypothetical protein
VGQETGCGGKSCGEEVQQQEGAKVMEGNTNFEKYPWSEVLEEWIKEAVKTKQEEVVICSKSDKGEFYSAITPGTSPYEAMMLAANIMSNAVLDIVLANADIVVNRAKEIEQGNADET